MAAFWLAGAGQLRAGAYDDQTIPGRWLKQLLPEKAEEPHYADYDKDSALAKAHDQYWAGQYRRALVTLESVKKGKPRDVAIIRGNCRRIGDHPSSGCVP